VGLVLWAGIALAAPTVVGQRGVFSTICAVIAVVLLLFGIGITASEVADLRKAPAVRDLGNAFVFAAPAALLYYLVGRGAFSGWAETVVRWSVLVLLLLASIFVSYLAAELPASLARQRDRTQLTAAEQGSRSEARTRLAVAFVSLAAALLGLAAAVLRLQHP
jgi:hypothetical protein